MPQGLFDKPKDKTPWIDPRFKQDQESTTPKLDQMVSAVGGFMGLPQTRNIGSPDYNASQYGSIASMALPFLGSAGKMLSGMRGSAPAMAGSPRGIAPSIQMIDDAPAVRQVMPAADDVNSLIGDMNRNLAKIQANRMAQPRGIEPSVMPPEFALNSQNAYNVGNKLPPTQPMMSYGARTNPSIGGRIDVVKMMNDLGNSRNTAKLQRGEISTR